MMNDVKEREEAQCMQVLEYGQLRVQRDLV